MRNIRTDLAAESHALLLEAAEEFSGITLNEHIENDIKFTHVKIESNEIAEKLKKPVGNYITLEFSDPRYMETNMYENICRKLSAELKKMIPTHQKNAPILIIGLGNRSIASDALGSEVIDRLMITRHLFSYAPDALTDNLYSVCAIAPGVLGITGIETEEIIAGICEKVKPCAVICVDALVARSIDRVTRTIQICDTGINPGAGVGNNRKEISKNTLGIPVVAIGVPTIVDAATITDDTLNMVIDILIKNNDDNSPFFKMLKNMEHDDRYQMIRSSVSQEMPHFLTTPKEIDILVRKNAELVANSINFALHDNLTFEDIKLYVS